MAKYGKHKTKKYIHWKEEIIGIFYVRVLSPVRDKEKKGRNTMDTCDKTGELEGRNLSILFSTRTHISTLNCFMYVLQG